MEDNFAFDEDFILDAFNSNANVIVKKKPEKIIPFEGYNAHRLAWFCDNEHTISHVSRLVLDFDFRT